MPTDAKLRGGYYTPPPIAEFLARWAIRNKAARVLEPSCGDGELLAAAARRLSRAGSLTGIELDVEEAAKAAARLTHSAEVVAEDVFTWFEAADALGAYDATLGNPPFIRYQNFPDAYRTRAFQLMHDAGLRPNRLTNAWVPFVVLATRALRLGGRIGFVVPAELLQVGYASELREYLVRNYSELTVVTFRRLVFDNIQQETVLLLGVRGEVAHPTISFLELDGLDDLRLDEIIAAERVEVDLDHGREKWTRYYLSSKELGLVRACEEAEEFTTLGEYADVDVGIVTGRNEFFVLTRAQLDELGLMKYAIPLVGRSAQTPGLTLRRSEWKALAKDGGRCFLLQLGDIPRHELTPEAQAYVAWGEQHQVHKGYKCGIRLPNWWRVPSAWVPDAFLLRQIHDGPRIIANEAGATCTDTIHRIRLLKPSVTARMLAAASTNSLTFAFAELRGRSYGGGVLELEPNEAEPLPFPNLASELPLDELDAIVREAGATAGVDEVDRQLLRGAGLTKDEVALLNGVWQKLSQRRRKRR